MKAHTTSLINAIVLVAMGAWGYFVTSAPTALIPVFFGILLLGLNRGVKRENKVIAHIAVLLTLLIIPGLAKPFSSALGDGDTLGMIRVGLMLVTSIIALIFFIKSFIDAKKARA